MILKAACATGYNMINKKKDFFLKATFTSISETLHKKVISNYHRGERLAKVIGLGEK